MESAFYFYIYSIISTLALGIHLIIHWKQLLDWRGVTKRNAAVEFRVFLVALSLFFPADILWGVFAELKMLNALYIDTVLFFVLLALCVFTWTRFAVAYLNMAGFPRRLMLWSANGMLAMFLLSLAVNHFTGSFFSMQADNIYRTGPLRDVMIILLVAFNVLCSAMTLQKLLTTKDAFLRRNTMIFVFCVTMVVSVTLQFWHPLLPFYAVGLLLGGCLLHVFVVEDVRDDAHKKELIAHDFALRLAAEQSANKAKSLFFSSVSHDIRTPLNAIIGFSELLENGVQDEDERKRFISSIYSSGKVLARLVDDVLDLSKLERGKLEIVNEPTDIPALVREVIGVCEIGRAGKSIVLKTELDAMPWVSVDPHRIRQILFNLLSNAYKYTTRGTITVGVHWRENVLTLSVADTGQGIAERDLARIFQPFEQVADRNNRSGTGLGLPICQKLASLMGGELDVDSKLGEGSTFTVTLKGIPPVEPPQDMLKAAPQPGEPSKAVGEFPRSSRVLVVDDSPVNRAVLKAMLAKCGVANVMFAEDGQAALALLNESARFDMVLTDLWMPVMDGHALIRAIRSDSKFASLPVYLLTADCDARNQANAAGFTGVLLKPITLAQLKQLFS